MGTSHQGKRLRIAVVGQTPPPIHGQALLIQQLLDTRLAGVEWVPVPMRFSRSGGEVGRPQLRKVLQLPGLVLRMLSARFRAGATVLYYPPASPDLVPILRDILLLGSTRWAYDRVVFHFHAGGLPEKLDTIPRPIARLARWVYGGADLAIVQSEAGISDGTGVGADRVRVLPCGIPDVADRYERTRSASAPPRILQIGTLSAAKGVLSLLDACDQLVAAEVPFDLKLAGSFDDPETEALVRRRVRELGFDPGEVLTGVVEGDRKWQLFRDADVFAFATSYYAETFGLVAIEGMQFELPVVCTRWRALPEIVVDGDTGLLVDAGDVAGLAGALEKLLRDPQLRRAMGAAGRQRFLTHYEAGRWAAGLEATLLSVASVEPEAASDPPPIGTGREGKNDPPRPAGTKRAEPGAPVE